MVVKVFDIDYDITEDDICDSVNCVVNLADIIFADNNREHIIIPTDIINGAPEDNGLISVIFKDDNEKVYFYKIAVLEDYQIDCILDDSQTFEGFALDIADELPQSFRFEIDESILTPDYSLSQCIEDLLNEKTNYLISDYDWETF